MTRTKNKLWRYCSTNAPYAAKNLKNSLKNRTKKYAAPYAAGAPKEVTAARCFRPRARIRRSAADTAPPAGDAGRNAHEILRLVPPNNFRDLGEPSPPLRNLQMLSYYIIAQIPPLASSLARQIGSFCAREPCLKRKLFLNTHEFFVRAAPEKFRDFEKLSFSGGIFLGPSIIEMPPFTSSEPACAANVVALAQGNPACAHYYFKMSFRPKRTK